jgi:hypothetical protein
LIEALIEVGIGEQSILVTFDVIERQAAFGSGKDQSPLFVDRVLYVRFPSHSSPLRPEPQKRSSP